MPVVSNIYSAYGGRKAFWIGSSDLSVAVTLVDDRDYFGINLEAAPGGPGLYTPITNLAELTAFAAAGGLGMIMNDIALGAVNLTFAAPFILRSMPHVWITQANANEIRIGAGADHSMIDGVNFLKTNTGDLIEMLVGLNDFTISHCNFHRHTAAANHFLYVNNSTNISILYNTFDLNVASAGMFIRSWNVSDRLTIVGNHINGNGNGSHGIGISTGVNAQYTLLGNIIHNTNNNGINISGIAGCSMNCSHNISTDNNNSGFAVDNSDEGSYKANVSRNNGIDGFRVMGGSNRNNFFACIAQNNGGWGFNDAAVADDFNNYSFCIAMNNTAGQYSLSAGSINVGGI